MGRYHISTYDNPTWGPVSKIEQFLFSKTPDADGIKRQTLNVDRFQAFRRWCANEYRSIPKLCIFANTDDTIIQFYNIPYVVDNRCNRATDADIRRIVSLVLDAYHSPIGFSYCYKTPIEKLQHWVDRWDSDLEGICWRVFSDDAFDDFIQARAEEEYKSKAPDRVNAATTASLITRCDGEGTIKPEPRYHPSQLEQIMAADSYEPEKIVFHSPQLKPSRKNDKVSATSVPTGQREEGTGNCVPSQESQSKIGGGHSCNGRAIGSQTGRTRTAKSELPAGSACGSNFD
jgi:hypothetical protein